MIRILFILLTVFISSCSKVNIQSYSNSAPALELKTFFSGDLAAYGMIQDRSGMVTRRFSADIKAWWEGDIGYLDETFYFDDGEETKRLWTLVDNGNGYYTGTAADVVGQANGRTVGFAFNWAYTLTIPYKESTIDVKLDDWLYLLSETRLMNKTRLKKFGFRVGDLTLFIEKTPE